MVVTLTVIFRLWLNARQLGTVLNRLNAWKLDLEIFFEVKKKTIVTGDPKRDRAHIVSMACDTLYNCATETAWQLISRAFRVICHVTLTIITVNRLTRVLLSLIYKNDFTAGHLAYLRPCPCQLLAFRHFIIFINKMVTQISVIYFLFEIKLESIASRYHTFMWLILILNDFNIFKKNLMYTTTVVLMCACKPAGQRFMQT